MSATTSPASSTSHESVLVVIVNYRTPGLTIDCLESLIPEREHVPGLEIVITDNLSGDDSVPRIKEFLGQRDLQSWMTFKPLDRNGGFAYGNNEAIRDRIVSENPPRYVLLLNPDTIVRPRAIRHLVDFLEKHPGVGLAGSRLEDPDGTPQMSAFRFPNVASELDGTLRLGLVSRLLKSSVVAPPIPNEETEIDWVAGASMLIRREVFDAIGLLDEHYFMYYEEVDFCWRARKAGWPCWYVPSSHVVHLVGQASGITNQKMVPKRRPDYWFESRRRYFLRNRGALYAMACDVAALGGLAAWQLRRLVERKKGLDPPKFLWDSCRHSVFLKGFSA